MVTLQLGLQYATNENVIRVDKENHWVLVEQHNKFNSMAWSS